ncbi:iron ABC transporter ATP-binding protein FetA [Rouxiella badensis]|uniref:iron efflux ABC transporter ATP-binding subunit FetA n=1 Tax=Rouxiella badensis TaxID=1646377 RepID=UPI001D148931|nr:iron ABC transporter ATP-binding protein FetA [Rouxiella badensis]MCC3718111.1 iron ABC transporter ATP-binding protein FetA [Rouxiella badensis]MCC3727121.1 iron ABC transporter ATP-binding protein FetA [Rouxiella badensis]MCC3731595.1 iron ABC transporter ATP-binding protein FetA [Rouxiella badensis]MCC3738530.1 iron ABC transporter ATP-binding protein FetA [Rouxiella badensis]MCC3756984.1 iron ABC transporter ATP-binding protein FetA [Rouxiella badensis]
MSSSEILLRLQDVSFSLNNQVLLRPTSLELLPGEFTLLTGPSGSGKSTLLKIVASLQNPTRGTVYFEGKDIRTLKPESYRQQVSYCFQTPVLFGQTVHDNLSLPYQIRGKKVDKSAMADWLERVNLSRSLLEKNVQELSGGEKQRVSLLRNLQFLPKVLLLDEITSALDEENKQNVNAIIAEQVKQQRLSVIWVTHDSNEIRHAQRVITLTREAAGESSHESA